MRSVRRGLIVMCAVAAIVLIFTGIGCPFRHFLGITCPGCGMTRATFSLAFAQMPEPQIYDATTLQQWQYRLSQAWYYHPLVFVTLPLIIYAFFAKEHLFGSAKREKIAVVLLVVLFFSVWLVRLLMGSEVVYFDLSRGMLFSWFLA